MITFENLTAMRERIKELEREGFKCTRSANNARYYSKNADHRVVLTSGEVKRGNPDFRRGGGAGS